MKHLVVGHGEIGKAIEEVLKINPENEVYYIDKNNDKNIPPYEMVDYMHVCMPYSDQFIKLVEEYSDRWLQKHTGILIIHSTVPIGTSRKLKAVSSPCRGVHPNLVKGLLTFVKYFCSDVYDDALKISNEFKKCGVPIKLCTSSPDDLEAAKLWDTTQYGWMIILNKAIFEWCQKNKVDFDIVYREFNKTYNEGYIELGSSHYSRPNLQYIEGPIGGHCVIPNLKYLRDSLISGIIEMMNDVEIKMEKK